MEVNVTRSEVISAAGYDKETALRVFNILSSLQSDVDKYCITVAELHESGIIDDFQYQLINSGLLEVSLACKDLSTSVEAVRKAIGDGPRCLDSLNES